MKENKIVPVMKSLAGKAKMWTKKNSSELLIAGSVVGFVTTVVLACVATKKADPIIQDAKEELEGFRNLNPDEVSFTEADRRREIAHVYIFTAGKLVKLYAPAIILGGLSIAGVISSNHIQRQRNLALGAAYSALDSAFRKYRERVREKIGEEAEKELWTGTKKEIVTREEADEQGTLSTVTAEEHSKYGDPISPYAVYFDASSPAWEKDAEENLFYLRKMQDHANVKFRSNRFLFLNDVLEMLELPKTKAGNIVGWRWRPNEEGGDNVVDFGIYNVRNHNAVNGSEPVFLLDFNVDGDILNDPITFRYQN